MMAEELPEGLLRRAAAHAALGDPGRLLLVEAVGVGDRSPSDLGQELGMSSNLLAHHLGVLERAGLVERVPSESDRRRTYVRLIPSALSELAVSAGPRPPAGRVVFICSANSARSQLAAAMWAQRVGPASSAGTHPADQVNPGAVATARRHRLRLLADAPAAVGDVVRPGDTLVTVCDAADREVGVAHIHWSVPDPVPRGGPEAFDDAYGELAKRIDRWLEVPQA